MHDSGASRVWVVLPAFNEAVAIGRVLDRTKVALAAAGISYSVVVVDDGSHDETAAIVERHAQNMPVKLVRHPTNLGLGATLRDGLLTASESASSEDVIVTLDADDTQPPELIPLMYQRVREGNDVVVASRYQPGAETVGVPFYRRILSDAASLVFRATFPIAGIRDFTCGFRAYRARALKEALADHGSAFFDQDGFQSMVDVLLKLRGRGLRFAEVPLVLRYDAKAGASKMRVMRTVWRTLLLIAGRRLRGSRPPSRL